MPQTATSTDTPTEPEPVVTATITTVSKAAPPSPPPRRSTSRSAVTTETASTPDAITPQGLPTAQPQPAAALSTQPAIAAQDSAPPGIAPTQPGNTPPHLDAIPDQPFAKAPDTTEPAQAPAAAIKPAAASPKPAATGLEAPATTATRDDTTAFTLQPDPARPAETLASSTPTSARPAPTTMPAQQVAPIAISLALGQADSASLRVTMDPAELGRVEISVERRGEQATVQVMAERPETLALLQRDARELDRALEQAGIGTQFRSLEFGLSQQGQDQRNGPWQGQGRPGGRATDDDLPPAALAAQARLRNPLSLLDIAI